MRAFFVLCLIYGAQSAALESQLNQKAQIAPDTKVVVTAAESPEPPVFVVHGFLTHTRQVAPSAALSAAGRRHQWASQEDHLAIKDECTKACGKGVDSSCVPECQVRLYGCLDYDRKTKEGAKEYAKCEKDVIGTYEEFAANWEKTHPYVSKLLMRRAGAVSATDIDNAQEECIDACGKGVDTSCVPECQVKMYHCLDHDRKVPEGLKKYEVCKAKVMKTYKNFAADWKDTHASLLVGHADDKAFKEIADECVEACGKGVDSSCVPECQVKMYTCLDHDRKTEKGAKKYKKCSAEVLSDYEKFADKWNEAHPYLLTVRRHVGSVELARVNDKCHDACGKGVDTSCVPECQVEMYSCLDHDRTVEEGKQKYDKCEKKVIAEYKQFGKKWDKVHPYGY